MTTSYEIFKDIKLIIITSSGPGNLKEILQMLKRLEADPDFSASHDVLWDARGRTDPLAPADVRKLADHVILYKGKSRPKRAYLVSKDVNYGMLRMYEAHREGKSNVDIEVFKDRTEALRWLGVHDHPLFRTGKYSR